MTAAGAAAVGRRTAVLALAALMLAGGLAGCGKRGSPERQPEWGPEPVPDSRATRSDGVVR